MPCSMNLGLSRKYNFLPPKRGIKRRISNTIALTGASSLARNLALLSR